MHIVFVHFNYPANNKETRIYENFDSQNIKVSIVQRNNKQFVKDNFNFVKDEFSQELKWWQNPETLNDYIGKLKPDMIYIFGLNLPLHFRWLMHHTLPNTIIIGQHCSEGHWNQRNLWLQQSALRIVDGFVFPIKKEANPWLKCAAILESQPIFELDNFRNNIIDIYNNMLKNKLETK